MHLMAWRVQSFALVVLLASSVTEQKPQGLLDDVLVGPPSRRKHWNSSAENNENQKLLRFKRFTESRPSNVPSVASIIDTPNQRTDSRPPVVVLDKVSPTPTREQILWKRIAELRERNRNSPSLFPGNNPTGPVSQTRGNPVNSSPFQTRPVEHSLTQASGTIVINDQDLGATFARCGHYLERCRTNTPGHLHGNQYSHRPVQNGGSAGHLHSPSSFTQQTSSFSHIPSNGLRHHQHSHRPAIVHFSGQAIPFWPS